jgi:hypothetical protein
MILKGRFLMSVPHGKKNNIYSYGLPYSTHIHDEIDITEIG